MKSILITGATGFIASHLLPTLTQKSYQLTAAIRHSYQEFPPYIKTIKIANIDRSTNWEKALQNIGFVIHLAARAHILQDNTPNPEAEFLKVNVEGTANLVRQSIQAGVKHFI
ncbi:MAG: NAD-dependent epimerase/dehydratase family protein, partial [Ekhidna sp.]